MDMQAASEFERNVARKTRLKKSSSTAHQKRDDLRCAQCSKCFAKPEHLQRHQRVHTGAKPFVCPQRDCERRFNRPDSLARHARTHRNEEQYDGCSSSTSPWVPPNIAQDGGPEADDYGSVASAFPAAEPNAAITHSPDIEPSLWSDADDLYALITGDPTNWSSKLDITLPQLPTAEPTLVDPHRNSGSTPVAQQAKEAMQHVDNMIQVHSFNLTLELSALGATSDFLDTCMSCFWSHFAPVFPVLHRPTLVLKECSSPLLLNMIALGSLFVADEGAVDKGQVLWRLAHHVVSTSWHLMLGTSAEANMMKGMQLVTSALLGQCYAIMSGDRSIRLISHVFHGLGFYWAHQSGLTGLLHEITQSTDDAAYTDSCWRRWSTAEVCKRILVGHYILDGLITQSSGFPSSTQHTINNLTLPCEDAAFEAEDPVVWSNVVGQVTASARGTCRELILDLFRFDRPFCEDLLPHMALPVILEAIQSLISEYHYATGPALGLQDQGSLGKALWRLFDTQISNKQRPEAHRLDLAIRWHIVCINLCVQPGRLLQSICLLHSIDQHLFTKPPSPSNETMDIERWCETHAARRASLHAISAIELIRDLPLSKVHALHLPLALNIAATILITFALSGRHVLRVAKESCWKTVCSHSDHPVASGPMNTEVEDFVYAGIARPAVQRNLSLYINTARSMLGSHMSSWGITKEMSRVLGELVAKKL